MLFIIYIEDNLIILNNLLICIKTLLMKSRKIIKFMKIKVFKIFKIRINLIYVITIYLKYIKSF